MNVKKIENLGEINYIVALDPRVLVVAIANKGKAEIQEWCAYIGGVHEDKHETQWEWVAKHGTKLPREIAELLFPEISKTHRWRR